MATMDLSPVDEVERIAAVRRYEILDTPRDGTFDRICALAARAFAVPIASVTIVDEDRIWFKALLGLDAQQIPRDPGLCASAIMQSGSYVVEDAARDPRTLSNPLVRGELGLRFYAAAPIVTAEGHRLGTVNVIDSAPRQVTDEEMATLHDLAAVVMDQLELRLSAIRRVALERELWQRTHDEKTRVERLATTLQRSLSPPSLPHVRGLELDVVFEPLADDVGGDFYDVFPLPDGEWGLFLGDVCGKGAPAAARTSLARYTLRSAGMYEREPADVVRSLNGALLLEPDAPMCSVVYGRMRPLPTTGAVDISLVVAGNPLPLHVRADGTVDEVAGGGPILGAFRDPSFRPVSLTLRAGEALLLHTDGITDATIDGERIEQEGLLDALRSSPDRAMAGAVASVRTLLRRAERPLRDDVALLAIGVPASPAG